MKYVIKQLHKDSTDTKSNVWYFVNRFNWTNDIKHAYKFNRFSIYSIYNICRIRYNNTYITEIVEQRD